MSDNEKKPTPEMAQRAFAQLYELEGRKFGVQITVAPIVGLAVIGSLQLASRHPLHKGYPAEIARQFAIFLQEVLTEHGKLADLDAYIQAGWDVANDYVAGEEDDAEDWPTDLE